jgi:hypothetical protein
MNAAAANQPQLLSDETTVAVLWPSIAATAAGRLVGRLAANRAGFGGVFTVGNLLALLTIPISLVAFIVKLLPGVARCYRLTTERIVVQRGMTAVEERSIPLDGFDAVQIVVLPGQRWLRAGDVVFKQGAAEVFRLPGVPHPEPFRQLCLKTRTALLSVRRVLRQQEVPA